MFHVPVCGYPGPEAAIFSNLYLTFFFSFLKLKSMETVLWHEMMQSLDMELCPLEHPASPPSFPLSTVLHVVGCREIGIVD